MNRGIPWCPSIPCNKSSTLLTWFISNLKKAKKISSKSEFIRDAIDFYTLFFERIVKIQGQEVDPKSLKSSYTVALQEVTAND